MHEVEARVELVLAGALGARQVVAWRRDVKGVASGWCRLGEPEQVLPAARALAGLGARLSMVSASLVPAAPNATGREVAYHFDLDGTTLTLTLELPLQGARVPSLTPVYRNADWQEREFRELYDIEVLGHPNPGRLFVDRSLEPALFERLIPYSTFINGASGEKLWRQVQAAQQENPS
ncbi:hydrogenase subunit CooU [Geomonas limicola]|uniref:Hydrogenase subunit CooU n=1 Tax=Geomonas limicola TaxID=2740186 RepID=A0A6V8N6R5_9BACT|nr:NADH-quinone oxidoreductase subunit C [Geomonas limicola]GFO67527.1 hydrogenase subunit CooU [Geomonas limicola]